MRQGPHHVAVKSITNTASFWLICASHSSLLWMMTTLPPMMFRKCDRRAQGRPKVPREVQRTFKAMNCTATFQYGTKEWRADANGMNGLINDSTTLSEPLR